MEQAKRRGKVIYSLAILAVAQIVVFGFSLARQVGLSPPWPQAGDTLPETRIRRPSGGDALLPSGTQTVLLVFHSTCGLCENVAPAWMAWMEEAGQSWNVQAVSSEPLGSALAFSQRHGWDMEVGVVEGSERGSRVWPFLSRTPWVFLVSGEGVILAEGHGERLEELVSQASLDANRVPF